MSPGIWNLRSLAIAGGALALPLAASAGRPWLAVLIALATVSGLVVVGWRQARTAAADGAGIGRLASVNARSIGALWWWAALSIFALYGSGILHWREWRTFAVVCAAVAGLSLVLSKMLHEEAADAPMLRLARGLGLLQAGGMVAAVIGLAIDGKLFRFAREDWGANIVFLFGALGILATTLIGIVAERKAMERR